MPWMRQSLSDTKISYGATEYRYEEKADGKKEDDAKKKAGQHERFHNDNPFDDDNACVRLCLVRPLDCGDRIFRQRSFSGRKVGPQQLRYSSQGRLRAAGVQGPGAGDIEESGALRFIYVRQEQVHKARQRRSRQRRNVSCRCRRFRKRSSEVCEVRCRKGHHYSRIRRRSGSIRK